MLAPSREHFISQCNDSHKDIAEEYIYVSGKVNTMYFHISFVVKKPSTPKDKIVLHFSWRKRKKIFLQCRRFQRQCLEKFSDGQLRRIQDGDELLCNVLTMKGKRSSSSQETTCHTSRRVEVGSKM